MASIDVQFVVAARVEPTMEYLRTLGQGDLPCTPGKSMGVLDYLERCRACGDLDPSLLACTPGAPETFEDEELQ